jgi:hypothetical protein
VSAHVTKAIVKLLADAGLTAKLIEAEEPDVVDDEFQILRGGKETGFTVQIGIGGHFYVNEHRNDAKGMVMVAYNEHRELASAFREAIDLLRRQHTLLRVEAVGAAQFRWVCSCGKTGIPVGSARVDGEDWARGAFKFHASRAESRTV